MADHARRSSPDECPLLHRFMAMEMDERWVRRNPIEMLETFHWFQGEAFALIIEDLLRLPRQPGIVVEGFRLLPHLVQPLLSEGQRAVWLLPSPEFRQAVVEARGGSQWGFLAGTSDPNRALCNLLARDRLFTDRLREETARLGLAVIGVERELTEDDLVERIMNAFEL